MHRSPDRILRKQHFTYFEGWNSLETEGKLVEYRDERWHIGPSCKQSVLRKQLLIYKENR